MATARPGLISRLVLLNPGCGLEPTPDLAAFGAQEDRLLEAGEVEAALVVSGGHDLPYFQQPARHLAAELASVTAVHLGWAGHLPSMERPEEITALILGRLTESPANGATPRLPVHRSRPEHPELVVQP
ncbi:alpha/beta fold hydrolase [Streptosporangium sp. CA-115845]|uniref:alpha/beta fold hydrolase n=1 Tax=Streptosporangium sp. CA-115845 TaxID=3240071 RepID=UPI003D8D522A